jgi:hypothetical protein
MNDFNLTIETPSATPAAKRSTKRDRLAAGRPDDFQTPAVALRPLLPYLKRSWRILEPACGKGNLVRALQAEGFPCVVGTDILMGADYDFLSLRKALLDCTITNPPYSLKDEFLAKCYELGKPFALLLPLTALEGKRRQALYRAHGLELILMDRRINFETPSGKQGGSWFASAWFTWGLRIGRGLTFSEVAA